MDEAFERLNNIDDKMSAFKGDSDISRVNLGAGTRGETVSSDTYFVVKKAIDYSRILEGTFDPTIRPIRNFVEYRYKTRKNTKRK